ncbi:MAG TPA: hypothetical protein VL995_11600 [Cellvibrio sp.]|nr:hypothetical protein [Cellvibrio sp.]
MKMLKAAIGIGHRASRRKQTGVATILVILMIGVGVVAVSVGTMHTMRNSQERQLVAHAQVNAQAGAWAAVEAVRQLLGNLTKEQLEKLTTNSAWEITGTDGLVQTATIKSVSLPSGTELDYKVKAEVSAVAVAGQSSSTIEVVYSVTPGTAPQNFTLNGILDFYNDLNVGGGITLNVPGGANFNVDGDFSATSVGVSGNSLGKIRVTGDIVLGSAVDASEIYGRNIKLQGSAAVKVAKAFGTPLAEGGIVAPTNPTDAQKKAATCCGNISMDGGTKADALYANGDVSLGSSSGIPVVEARGNVALTGGGASHGTIKAGKNIDVTQGSSAASLDALGNIGLSGDFSVPIANASGNISCNGNGWKNYPSLNAGGIITGCNTNQLANNHPNKSPAPSFPLMAKLEPVKLIQPRVDAWSLQAAANYAFHYDGTDLKVTISNINTIANDTYFVKARVANNPREYICKTLTAGYCAGSEITLCNGFSANNGCFTATKTNGVTELLINGKSFPPGVVWVNGHLTLANGRYYNTFVATGNIATQGATVSYALNYAAAYKDNPASTTEAAKNAICKNEFASGYKINEFANLYPANYCAADGKYTPNALGNIGFLAGGYDPADPANATTKTKYFGGLIKLGNSNTIYGSIVAGDLLETGGQTLVYGYISAAGLKLSDSDNVLGGSTTVDVTNLPEGYKPNEIPDMSGGGVGITASSRVLWTRYL